jgi:hypothetical protein
MPGEKKENHFETVNQFISDAMQFLNKLLFLHWNTGKYPVHFATNEVYNDWHETLDSFVEKYLGAHISRKSALLLHQNNSLISRNSKIADDITNLVNYISELKKIITPDSLNNILDDFLNILYQLNFLLSLN